MISNFNLTKLNTLLKDFYTITQIRITVFDDTFHELAAYPKEIAPFCQLIRTDKNAAAECMRCDTYACEKAARQHTPYTYRCHAGLTESIVPLYLGNIVIGYLLFGHVFSYPSHEDGWKVIEKLCASYDIDKPALKKACGSVLSSQRITLLPLPISCRRLLLFYVWNIWPLSNSRNFLCGSMNILWNIIQRTLMYRISARISRLERHSSTRLRIRSTESGLPPTSGNSALKRRKNF